jgi:hypothetical protein
MANVNPSGNTVYITARRDSKQKIPSGTWGGKNIIMNVKQGGGIQYDNNTGVFRLEKDTPYRITAQLGWDGNNIFFKKPYYAFGLFNVDTGKQIGPLAEKMPPSSHSFNASCGLLDMIHTPEVTGDYCLRMEEGVTAPAGTFIRDDISTYLNIVPVTAPCLSARRLKNQILKPEQKPEETWKDRHINLDNITYNSGINYYEYKRGSNIRWYFKPEGGKTYRVTAQLGWEADTSGYYQFGLFVANDDIQIGPLAEALPPNAYTSNASSGLLDVIFTPFRSDPYTLRTSPGMVAGLNSEIRANVGTILNIVELPASKSYLSTRRFSDQLIDTRATDPFRKDIRMNMQAQHGDIAYFPEYGVFTLQEGKAYRITAQLGWEASEPRYYKFGVFDFDTNDQIGPAAELLPPGLGTSWNASGGVLDVIHVPLKSGKYVLRVIPDGISGTTGTVRGDVDTFMNVVEL